MKKKVSIIIVVIILIITTIFTINIVKERLKKHKKLNIVTYIDNTQAFHPKVVNFNEEWNGYKYWMSYTPYPNCSDSFENPSIAVSNDKINWVTPNELTNPLDKPSISITSEIYNSDSHLVYNSKTNELECYWRNVNFNKVTIYKMRSKDGTNWSKKEKILYSDNRKSKDYISISVIYEDNKYKAWYVNADRTLNHIESKDGYTWSNPIKIDFIYDENITLWHFDIIHSDLGYEIVSVAYDDWNNNKSMSLYYAISNDGINNFTTNKKILTPSTNENDWDNQGIYRSSIIRENGKYYIFYSGINTNRTTGIGLVYGESIDKLKYIK